eukprot:2945741-Prymnesium_polylepis.1
MSPAGNGDPAMAPPPAENTWKIRPRRDSNPRTTSRSGANEITATLRIPCLLYTSPSPRDAHES